MQSSKNDNGTPNSVGLMGNCQHFLIVPCLEFNGLYDYQELGKFSVRYSMDLFIFWFDISGAATLHQTLLAFLIET